MHPTRRSILRGAAAGALAALPVPLRSEPERKLRIAGVGIGGMGGNNLTNLASQEIVALCDVDDRFLQAGGKRFPKARGWKDFREMLAGQPEIEAVMIATPDHTHAAVAAAALRAGKHVYCQKPLSHNIAEARLLARLAAETKGVVAVMGNQHHSSGGTRKVVEWVQAGVIGEVRRVVAWCALRYRPFGHAGWATLCDAPPAEVPPVPESLAWDLWLGPAPVRPFHPTYHPARWRAWWDFGCGMMGDRGVHTLDASCWALDLHAPERVELVRKEGDNEHIHPDLAHVRYHFPARGKFPPLVLDWHSGERPAEIDALTGGKPAGDAEGGALLVGSDGCISHGTYADQPVLHPESKAAAARDVPASLPRVRGSHEMAWVAACLGQGPASSPFDYAARLTELAHLGNLAVRMGGSFLWDSVACRATDRPEAEAWIRRPRRPGWNLEA